LKKLLDKHQPQLVLYDAGVDIFAGDPLGRLQVSEAGIRQRDRMVLTMLRSRNIPVATVIGGGYDDNRQALARRHAMVIEEAAKLVSWPQKQSD
ncbi:MAG: histone deacetylase, partial [Porticoccaceae bacterium]